MYAGTLSCFAQLQALQLANAQGQKIYKIDSTNIDIVLPKLNLSNTIKQNIQNSVNQGKYVLTHTDNVSVPGWSGSGYAIIDPLTGSNAYMISGGANGGFILILAGTLLLVSVMLLGIFGFAMSAIFQVTLMAVSYLFMTAGLSLILGFKKACVASMLIATQLIKSILLKGWSKPFAFVYAGAMTSPYKVCQCDTGGC